MSAFRYVEPAELAEALDLIADPDADAHLLAGGTAFVPLLKTGYVQPSLVVGMRRLSSLRTIERQGESLVIGSLATHSAVAGSSVVAEGWPMLAEACQRVGTIRIRNQGTLGGNVVHADPNQDPPPVLLVLDATARVIGPSGERQVLLDELFVDVFETTVGPGEILLDLQVPPVPNGSRWAYRKFLPRSQDDYGTVAVAALVRQDDEGRVLEARVAVGGAAPRPIRAGAVEQALVGMAPSADAITAAADQLDAALDPIDDVRGSASYKRRMARVWVERTLGELCGVPIP